jgi:hypothetical protein
MQQLVETTQQSGLGPADYAGIFGALVAALGLAGSARSVFRRTLGRTWDVGNRLSRIGTGMQLAYCEALVGRPPALRRAFSREEADWSQDVPEGEHPPTAVRDYTECFWVDPLFYLQTVSDPDGSVVAFTITTRSRRFHPYITLPIPATRWQRWQRALTRGRKVPPAVVRVELGRTRFAYAASEPWNDRFPAISAWRAAHAWSYSEAWAAGNPGFYQHFITSLCSASGVRGWLGHIEHVNWSDEPPQPDQTPKWALEMHDRAVITTGWRRRCSSVFGPLAHHRAARRRSPDDPLNIRLPRRASNEHGRPPRCPRMSRGSTYPGGPTADSTKSRAPQFAPHTGPR